MKIFQSIKPSANLSDSNDLFTKLIGIAGSEGSIIKLLQQDKENKIDIKNISKAFENSIKANDLVTAHRILQLRPDEDLQLTLQAKTVQSIASLSDNPSKENLLKIRELVTEASKSSNYENIQFTAAEAISKHGKDILRSNNPEEIDSFLDMKPYLGASIENVELGKSGYSLASYYLNHALTNVKSQPYLLTKVVNSIINDNQNNPQILQDVSKLLIDHAHKSKDFTEIRIITDAIKTIPENTAKHEYFQQNLSDAGKENLDQLSSILEQIHLREQISEGKEHIPPLEQNKLNQLHDLSAALKQEFPKLPNNMQNILRLRVRDETERYIKVQIQQGNITEATRAAESAQKTGIVSYSKEDEELKSRSYITEFLAAEQSKHGIDLLHNEETQQFEEFLAQKPILYSKYNPFNTEENKFDSSLGAEALKYASYQAANKPEILDQVLTLLKEQNPVESPQTSGIQQSLQTKAQQEIPQTYVGRIWNMLGSQNEKGLNQDQAPQSINEENAQLFYTARDKLIQYSNAETIPEKRTSINQKLQEHLGEYLIDDREPLRSIVDAATKSDNIELISIIVKANSDNNYERISYNDKTIKLLLDSPNPNLAKAFVNSQQSLNSALQDLSKPEHIKFIYSHAAELKLEPHISDSKTIEKVAKIALAENPVNSQILQSLTKSISKDEDQERKSKLFSTLINQIASHKEAATILYSSLENIDSKHIPVNEKAIQILEQSNNIDHKAKSVEIIDNNREKLNTYYQKFLNNENSSPGVINSQTSTETPLEKVVESLSEQTIASKAYFEDRAKKLNALIKNAPFIEDEIISAFKGNPKLFSSLSTENINRITDYVRKDLPNEPEKGKTDWRDQFLYHLTDKNSLECKTGQELRKKVSNLIFEDEGAIKRPETGEVDHFQQYIDKKDQNEKLKAATGIVASIKKFLRNRRAHKQGKTITEYEHDKLQKRLIPASKEIINSAATATLSSTPMISGAKIRTQ